VAEVVLTDATLRSEFSAWMLLTGPAIHLWFMPFAFCASLLIWPLARFIVLFSDRWRGISAAVGVTLAVLLMATLGGITTAPPFAQWFFALPAVAFGTGIGSLHRTSNLTGVLIVCTAALVVGAWAAGWPSGSSQLVIASAALSLCMLIPTRKRPAASWLADISVTLYLAHPLVVAVLLRLTPLQEGSLELLACVLVGTILLATLLHGKQVSAVNPFASQGKQS
jgi:peptidoglycan/LPS O-acetylase OafA/YrhL